MINHSVSASTFVRAGALAVIFALSLACGGGGGGDGNQQATNSPFAGEWLGTWTSPSLGRSGTATVTIATTGSTSGGVYDNASGRDGALSGAVASGGQFNGASQYPGEDATALKGTMVLVNGGNAITGNLLQTISGADYGVIFNLVRKAFPLSIPITVRSVNTDAVPIHILIGGEAFSTAVNRVAPGGTLNRTSPLSYTWDTATDTVTITIFAGRNGVVLDQADVTLNGQERMDGKGIRAVWNANQTVSVTKQ